MVNFDLPKVSKMTSLNIYIYVYIYIYISSHREGRNIKFGHQMNIIQRVSPGSMPQVLVMSLAHNHLTNLFILNYRGAAVIKFKQ